MKIVLTNSGLLEKYENIGIFPKSGENNVYVKYIQKII